MIIYTKQIILLLWAKAQHMYLLFTFVLIQVDKKCHIMRKYHYKELNQNNHLLKAMLEKEMATHSSTLAWKIPWMEEPGRLQSTGSQRVRCD